MVQQQVDGSTPGDVLVVVIGGGISGVATATELVKQQGFHVILIEAQEKVGGRMRSNRDIDFTTTTTTNEPTATKEKADHDDTISKNHTNNENSGYAFDEGASWVVGQDNNPIAELGKVSNMKTIRMNEAWNTITYDIGGVQYDQSVYKTAESHLLTEILPNLKQNGSYDSSFEEIFDKFCLPMLLQSNDHANTKKANKNHDNDNNGTMQTTCNDDEQVKRLWNFLLSTFVQFDLGDLNLLSSINYGQGEGFTGGETFVTGGFETIPQYLLQQFLTSSLGSSSQRSQLLLNTKVYKIDSLSVANKVQVHIAPSSTNSLSDSMGSSNSTIVADYVVVTVPLGVLKANAIEFIPSLPKWKQTAIDTVGMNCVNKYLLIFDTAFWDTNVAYIHYTTSCNKHQNKDKYSYFVNLTNVDPSINALITFAYADPARQSEHQTDDEVVNEIMYNLRDMYGTGNKSIPNPIKLVRTKWHTNPYTYGSYSYYQKETKPGHYYDLSRPICNDTIFFAGEHTYAKYYATTHGAYLSGISAAQNIIDIVHEKNEANIKK